MKRFLCTCIILSMMFSLFGGFAYATEGAASADASSAYNPEYFKKYEPTVTFTQNMVQYGASDMRWYEGENIENNAYTKWVEDTCGVKFKAKWIVSDFESDTQKMNIAAASNDLPDIINAKVSTISKLVKAGLVMPIDDLIEQYGSPLTKYVMQSSSDQSRGNLKLPFTVDGKLYAYPVPLDTPGFWSVNWIRQDILDELGKPVPETIGQLEDVLAAYKEKYPDGVGIPLDKNLSLNLVMSAFNAATYNEATGHWYLNDNDEIVYGSIQPQVKEGLALLRDWYQKGYIDREFVAKTPEKIMEDFARGDMLCWGPGFWWNAAWPFPDLFANVPAAKMANMPILKGENGEQLKVINTEQSLGVAVNKNVKNPEALVYVLNESLDSFYRSIGFVQEDMKKIGYQFKYPYTEEQVALNADDPDRVMDEFNYEVEGYGFFNKGRTHVNTAFGFKGDLPKLYELILAEVADIAKTGKLEGHSILAQNEYNAIGSNPKNIEAFIPMYDYWSEFQNSDSVRPNMLVCSPTDTQIEKSGFLRSLELEAFARIIMGTDPLDAFDKFVEDWKSNGGEQWTKEVNEWYQSTK